MTIDQSIQEQEGQLTQEEEQVYLASQWQLMWWKFRKHKLAMAGTVVLALLYLIAIFAEFLAPYDPNESRKLMALVPPQGVHFMTDEGFSLRPYVYGLERERDMETLRLHYTANKDEEYPVEFLVSGPPYEMWGLFESDLHLFGVEGEGRIFLLGTDRLGRDIFSRVLYGTRISMSVGLVGIALSFMLGITLGGISGYYAGTIDVVIQRLIEFLRSVPSVPLWMALSASLPATWPPLRIYFGITVILSLIGWTGLARVVRGRFLALREEDFVMAARLAGSGEMRIILRHMVPSFFSYIIASLTLSIPSMILSETSLSFLGLGLRPPVISWGVLLQGGQNLQAIAQAPWLLTPGLFVIIAVLAFNFVGDGMRDAADPYVR